MKAQEMWKAFQGEGSYSTWSFGQEEDKLAELVLQGRKRATSSAYALYEIEGEPLPQKGYSIILDAKGEGVCIIKTTKVYVVEYHQVSSEHAFLEGEGDRSLEYWRKVHEDFFKKELKKVNREFDEKMKVVCEEFVLVYPKIEQ